MASPLLLCLLVLFTAEAQMQKYILLVDAGSTGSRMYVYSYEEPPLASDTIPTVTEVGNLRVTPGISSFASNQAGVPAYVNQLTDYAKTKVNTTARPTTPVYFYCTAGMRLLTGAQISAVLGSVRTTLSVSGFKFANDQAQVISGEAEGVTGWVSLARVLNQSVPSFPDVWLDMGGASTQVTFPKLDVLSNYFSLKWGSSPPIPLYTVSYLEFGTDRFLLQYKDSLSAEAGAATEFFDPCAPVGYNYSHTWQSVARLFVGSGNSTACSPKIPPLLKLAAYCKQPPCAVAGEYQPDFPFGTTKIYAVSAFSFGAAYFGFAGQAASIDAVWAAAQLKCANNYTWLRDNPVGTNNFAQTYCFNAAYFYNLLTLGYRLPSSTVIEWGNNNAINGMTATWALGAALFEANLLPRTNIPLPVPPTPSPKAPLSAASSCSATSFVLLASLVAWLF